MAKEKDPNKFMKKIAEEYPELTNLPIEKQEIVRAYYEIVSAKQARIQVWIIVALTVFNIILTLINVLS